LDDMYKKTIKMEKKGTAYYKNGQKSQAELYGELKSLPLHEDNLIDLIYIPHSALGNLKFLCSIGLIS